MKPNLLNEKTILIWIIMIAILALLGVILISEQTATILSFSGVIIAILLKMLQDDRIARQQEIRDEAKRVLDVTQIEKVEEAKEDLKKVADVAEKLIKG